MIKNMSIRSKIIISIVTLIINSYCLFIFANNYHAIYYPVSARINIASLLNRNVLQENDYRMLFSQTGLGKQAIDDIRDDVDSKKTLLTFQDSYFRKNRIVYENLNPFTIQETLKVNSINSNITAMAPLKNGDILLTKSTYTLFWRHGHCGIVIDAARGTILESLEPGTVSMTQNISKWQNYSTLKVIRLKDTNTHRLNEIAKYAAEKLSGIKYDIFAPKRYDDAIPKSENCAQIIWQAYHRFGYDIDSNRGTIVTPSDIARSKLLEVIQINGFNPDKPW